MIGCNWLIYVHVKYLFQIFKSHTSNVLFHFETSQILKVKRVANTVRLCGMPDARVRIRSISLLTCVCLELMCKMPPLLEFNRNPPHR